MLLSLAGVPKEDQVNCQVGGKDLTFGINIAGVAAIERITGRGYKEVSADPRLYDVGAVIYVAELNDEFENPGHALCFVSDLSEPDAEEMMEAVRLAAALAGGEGPDLDGLENTGKVPT
jgi:hypothetical protein